MKLIHKSRREGKTTDLIEEARKLPGYNLIVCYDKAEADRIWKIIREKEYDLAMPISFGEFITGKYGFHINNFLIDNVDMLLQDISKGVNIHAITLNKGTK